MDAKTHKFTQSILKMYDIRGVYNKDFNNTDAYFMGKAYGTFLRNLNKKTCVVGRDGRVSSEEIQKYFMDGLITTGINAIDLVFNNDKIKLYDDYAHHHTQIKCTIQAIKDNIVDSNNEKIIAILEPHLISRIKNNTKEFVDALLLADYSIVTKIFKSRESFMADIDVKSLLNNDRIDYIENYDDFQKLKSNGEI